MFVGIKCFVCDLQKTSRFIAITGQT